MPLELQCSGEILQVLGRLKIFHTRRFWLQLTLLPPDRAARCLPRASEGQLHHVAPPAGHRDESDVPDAAEEHACGAPVLLPRAGRGEWCVWQPRTSLAAASPPLVEARLLS